MLRRMVSITLLFLMTGFFATANADNIFRLMTNDFSDSGTLPDTFTCDGSDVSPELYFTNIPPKTVSMALVVSDPDAPTGSFYHWIVINIPPDAKEFPRGISKFPPGTLQTRNHFGNKHYDGPCPPTGATHAYLFTLYALDTMLDVDPNTRGHDVLNLIRAHMIQKAVLTALYGR